MVDWAGREVILRYVAVWVGGCEDMGVWVDVAAVKTAKL